MNLRRSITKRVLRRAARRGSFGQLDFGLLGVLGYDGFEAAPADGEADKVLDPVTGPDVSEVVAPKLLGCTPDRLRREVCPIRPMVFRDVEVTSEKLVFRRDGLALVPHVNANQLTRLSMKGATCVCDHHGKLLFSKLPLERIEKGICGIGHAAANWYHWFIEVLPTIMLAGRLPETFDDYPLLVPEEVLAGETFRDTLEIFRSTREVLPLRRDRTYALGELVFIPSPTHGPINMQDGLWPEPADYTQNMQAMAEFRDRILASLGLDPMPASPRRIFLARPAGSRSYNSDELEAIAADRGFHIQRPERLSFREQVALFRNADVVIGPSGAAWACSLFLRPGSRGLIWALKEYAGACFYSNLTLLSGADLTYMLVDAHSPVRSTHEAYFASYSVPADLFATQLDAVLAG